MVSYDGSNSDSFKEITINSKFEMKKKILKKKKENDAQILFRFILI